MWNQTYPDAELQLLLFRTGNVNGRVVLDIAERGGQKASAA